MLLGMPELELPLGAQMLNVLQTAELLGVHRNTVSLYLRQGLLKGEQDHTRTWRLRRDEVQRFIRERGGQGVKSMLEKVDEAYMHAVACVGVAASRYLDENARLETYRGTDLRQIPERVLQDFQQRLDGLVECCEYYAKLAMVKGTLAKLAAEDVRRPAHHPEDRPTVEDPAPREQEA
jgi:excisionase family DNA binding protein